MRTTGTLVQMRTTLIWFESCAPHWHGTYVLMRSMMRGNDDGEAIMLVGRDGNIARSVETGSMMDKVVFEVALVGTMKDRLILPGICSRRGSNQRREQVASTQLVKENFSRYSQQVAQCASSAIQCRSQIKCKLSKKSVR